MRGLQLASLGLLVFTTSAGMAACSADAEDCAKTRTCGGATTQSSSSSSSTGGPLPACIPGPDQTQVGADCGIFVATTGDDGAEGTQAAPVKTLAQAIQLASSKGAKAIYACTGAYAESIELPGGVSLFGGLDCMAGWTYKDAMTRSSLTGDANKIPLKITGAGTVNIGNFDVTAVDATDAGGSSVAALVDGTAVSWTAVRLVAGAAMNGADGTTPDPVGATDPMDPTIVGNVGVVACSMGATDNPGGMEKANPTCNTAIGGAGGTGLVDTGSAGADGQPLPNPNPAPGNWGLGGTGAGNLPCQAGQGGLIGTDGAAGTGATGLGTLSAAGFVGAAGADGTPGTPGQGGGGGGGAKGKAGCAGASGGGGGAGGCGGPGGLGGKGGGSSIALISLNASMTFKGVDLSTKAGGNGGNGGDGQNGSFGGYGGVGGLGTMGTLKGCTGGDGGAGGFGGKGGGGAGGHSIGIAFSGTAPVLDGATVQKGAAGTGGTGMDAAGNGAAGVSVDTQSF